MNKALHKLILTGLALGSLLGTVALAGNEGPGGIRGNEGPGGAGKRGIIPKLFNIDEMFVREDRIAEPAIQEMLPPSFMDQTGFEMPEDPHNPNFFAMEGFQPDPRYPSLPFLPLVGPKKRDGILGAYVPNAIFDPRVVTPQSIPAVIIKKSGGMITIDGATPIRMREELKKNPPKTPEDTQGAIEGLRALGLEPQVYESTLVGVIPGRALPLKNPDQDSISIHESSDFGLSLFGDGGLLGFNFGKVKFDLSQAFRFHKNKFTEYVNTLFATESSEKISRKTLAYMQLFRLYNEQNRSNDFIPFMNQFMREHAHELQTHFSPLSNPSWNFQKLPALKNYQFQFQSQPQPERLKAPVPVDRFCCKRSMPLETMDLQRWIGKSHTDKAIKHELKWQELIHDSVSQTAVYDDQESQFLIQSVCNRLAQAYGVPEALWPKCRIQASMMPNAWAYPGGEIFITAGLLGIISDLDGIQFILGHEIGHNVGRHTSRSAPYWSVAGKVSSVVGLAAMGFTMMGGMGYIGPVTLLNYFPQMMASSIGSSLAATMVDISLLSGLAAHSRLAEAQADAFGHQAALSVGAEESKIENGWREFSGFVEKYFKGEPGFLMRILEPLLRSHPRDDKRQAQLERDMKEKVHQTLASEFGNANRLEPEFYEHYKTLHQRMKPYSIAYGEYIKAIIERNSKKKLSEFHSGIKGELDPELTSIQQFVRMSQGEPGNRCLYYVLGKAQR